MRTLLTSARSVVFANSIDELEALACGTKDATRTTVAYQLPDGRVIDEVHVVRSRNGISANYLEPYMRRRDPDCMLIADDKPSDKPSFVDRFGCEFAELRKSTFDWLKSQELAVYGFEMGQPGLGADALAICPANAGFFAFGLGLLQGIVNIRELQRPFAPSTIIYVAPPFRHTHFDGKQVVVHYRNSHHEIFSYNLYPGPSAKKGVYGALIELGEQQGWITAHCAAVQVVTPYDNILNLMHEGASGGGKSETLQQPHREPDGRLLLGRNILTDEARYIELPRTCELRPVCDDMALCHPEIQLHEGELTVTDAEEGWFVRVDHITEYGTDPDLESRTIHPRHSQLFLNIDAVAGGTALIWEHIEDAPGKPCPNPRVIVPRANVPDAIREPVPIDVRSFGVRTPPCTADTPSYGIIGLMHILPPALAWLWRLVAPRGHANPSIVDTAGMSSEGVGSYWPFATGTKVAQANLLLRQFQAAFNTLYVLIPNQHIGAWKTGFMPQWLARDYLARRGHASFRAGQIVPSRCSLLGYALDSMRIEGTAIPRPFLQVDTQPEVGVGAFDAGAAVLDEFFDREVHLGIIKGGQLGRMLLTPCMKLGIVPHIMDNDPAAPARAYCNNFTVGDATVFEDVYAFGNGLDAVTIEVENVNKDALNNLREEGVTVHPSPELIALVQDKGLQKQFYTSRNLPTSDFVLVENREQLRARGDLLPCVQKSRMAGYDGRGVVILESESDFDRAFDVPSVIERKVSVRTEVSVLVARNRSGQVKTYPAVEMVVHGGRNMLDYLRSPARIAPDEQRRATHIAEALAEELDLAGLLAVEMFVTETGDVLINEVAPRPHNSGHHTIETNTTSQYEQHLRSIFDLSLGSTEMLLPSVMVNIVGERGQCGPVVYKGIEPFLQIPGVYLHLYGKKMVQPFRKMGHITIVRSSMAESLEIAHRIKQEVRAISCPK